MKGIKKWVKMSFSILRKNLMPKMGKQVIVGDQPFF